MQKKFNINRTEMSGLRGELIEIINQAVDDALFESNRDIKNIVEEYSERRGKGESK